MTKHEEWINGSPIYGDRSKTHPGCPLWLEKDFFGVKSWPREKERSQPRPRFAFTSDSLWNDFRDDVNNKLPKYEADAFLASKRQDVSDEIKNVLIEKSTHTIQPKQGKSYYPYSVELEEIMKHACCSIIKSQINSTIPESNDLFSDIGHASNFWRLTNETLPSKNSKPISEGWIYMIKAPYDNNVKIGKAKKGCLRSRVQEAQRHREGSYLHKAFIISYYETQEKAIHRPIMCYKVPAAGCKELFTLPQEVFKSVEQKLLKIAHETTSEFNDDRITD